MTAETRRIEVREEPAGGVIAVAGELDVAGSESLDRRLNEIDASRTVALDLSEITFVDSSGLRVVVQHHLRLASGGGRLTLLQPSTQVRRLLEIAGLADRLDLG
jgi:anti-sigma B factor antagonist